MGGRSVAQPVTAGRSVARGSEHRRAKCLVDRFGPWRSGRDGVEWPVPPHNPSQGIEVSSVGRGLDLNFEPSIMRVIVCWTSGATPSIMKSMTDRRILLVILLSLTVLVLAVAWQILFDGIIDRLFGVVENAITSDRWKYSVVPVILAGNSLILLWFSTCVRPR